MSKLKVLKSYRELLPGMGQAVAERTILRKKENGKWENWGDVAGRVALGNSLLCKTAEEQAKEYKLLKKHISNATLLMSGRHLQHGDATQPQRNAEVFTNCATSPTSFLLFFLLLNGCFKKGTKVKMAGGTYKNIEDVKKDEIVVSFNEDTKEFVIQHVSKLNINMPKLMVKITLDNKEEIYCTHDHKFLTNKYEWVEAKNLKNKVLKSKPNQNNNNKKPLVPNKGTVIVDEISTYVIDVEYLEFDNQPVYDLTVENTHNYLVSKSDIVVHNSGVGRCYDDDMMLVNWDNAPDIRCVLRQDHPDFDWSAHESVREAKHKYGSGKDVLWFKIPDSREGWAKALEIWENSAFEKIHKDKILILDFSDVRPSGAAIGGMQNRPASGPVPLMNAFSKAASLKSAGLPRWKQALEIDHCFAACVLVGGARRCLPENYLIKLENNEWKKIKDINIGELILINNDLFEITDKIDNGEQETIKIYTDDGKYHISTPEHKWLVFNHNTKETEWVEAKNLSLGNFSFVNDTE